MMHLRPIVTEQPPDTEPVAAYDRVARYFDSIRSGRQTYCDAVDNLVLANWPTGARSMLDVGCGDGTRAEKLAQRAGVERLLLLEPSAGMRRLIRPQREVWASRVEELSANRTFDVITCLWNVLGHVPTTEKKLQALRNMHDLLSPVGTLFLDLQNRYNTRLYGALRTAARMTYDLVSPSLRHGDVTVRWEIEGREVRAYGHVFTRKEILNMFGKAGLAVRKSEFVDYSTGQLSGAFSGSMFFALGR